MASSESAPFFQEIFQGRYLPLCASNDFVPFLGPRGRLTTSIRRRGPHPNQIPKRCPALCRLHAGVRRRIRVSAQYRRKSPGSESSIIIYLTQERWLIQYVSLTGRSLTTLTIKDVRQVDDYPSFVFEFHHPA